MASGEQIAAALQLAEAKKSRLRKAYEDLKSHCPPVSSFNLQWNDLESHFTSIQNSIKTRLKDLETKENLLNPKETLLKPHNPHRKPPKKYPAGRNIDALKEQIQNLCAGMDSKGLILLLKENKWVRSEVGEALLLAPDGAKLVLDAIEGVKDDKGLILKYSRKTCVILLQELTSASVQIKDEVRVEAVRVAREWKGMLVEGNLDPWDVMWFLQFLVTYGLQSAFGVDEIFGVFQSVILKKKAKELCGVLGLNNKVHALILSLIEKEQRIEAVKLIYAYGLVDKFPPVPLLKGHLRYTRKLATRIRKEKNNSTDAQVEEDEVLLAGLRAIRNCIFSCKLESEYPPYELGMQIRNLQSRVAKRKPTFNDPAVKAQPQQQNGKKVKFSTLKPEPPRQKGRKRNRSNMSSKTAPSAYVASAHPTWSPTYQGSPYLTAAATQRNVLGSYGLAGSRPFPPYATPQAGPSRPAIPSSAQYGASRNIGEFGFMRPESGCSSPNGLIPFHPGLGMAVHGHFERPSWSKVGGHGLPPPWNHPSTHP